ncbi:TPA: helix-turn-helix domain-containing protein [Listeria monocytogenes]|nr:helix-turn-helix domain-containing protein [Listeria monocytogenes]HAA9070651.1 helix-turn-helix domain-containing protein [Listeria monocytogenes]HDI4828552.1 helix-turn-helix domain-containing protein [Listeria monocytogenes]HDM9928133.1 helix-turn-helix domain-containing protein [Listeria monocytogenes]
MNKDFSRVPFEIIFKASNGDIDSINMIKKHFRPYIIKHSSCTMIADSGHSIMIVDQTLFGRLECRLLTKILSFKID